MRAPAVPVEETGLGQPTLCWVPAPPVTGCSSGGFQPDEVPEMAPQGSGAADLAQITVQARGDSWTPQELAGRGTRTQAGARRCSCSCPEAGRRPVLGHKGGKETSPPQRHLCCKAADPVLPTNRRALGTGSPAKARRRGRRDSNGVGELRAGSPGTAGTDLGGVSARCRAGAGACPWSRPRGASSPAWPRRTAPAPRRGR